MKRIALLLGLLLAPVAAQAQEIHGFTPCSGNTGAQTINASNVSSGITLKNCGPNVLIYNIGTVEAFYAISTAGTAATTSSYSIPANTYINLVVPNLGATLYQITAITAASTTTLRITQGNNQ